MRNHSRCLSFLLSGILSVSLLAPLSSAQAAYDGSIRNLVDRVTVLTESVQTESANEEELAKLDEMQAELEDKADAKEDVSETETVSMVVTGGTINVRTGPGTNYDKITQVVSGKQVTVVGETNGWYQVKFDSTTGWLLGEYLRDPADLDGTVGANIVSMAAAGVHLAERIFDSVTDQRILFIGAGEMIELCAAHFCAEHPRQVTVANRTVERGLELSNRFGGNAIRLDQLPEYLPEHDIVVSCTASPLPIIGLGMVERAIKARRHRPIFIVDLAVPRDVEQEVGELDDVFLYTVDDLAQIVESGVESRQAAVVEAEGIIGHRVHEFLGWLQARDTVPVIRALRDAAERSRQMEVERALKLLARGEAAEDVIRQLSLRLSNKLLHAPSSTLNSADGSERAFLQAGAERLFHLHDAPVQHIKRRRQQGR